MTSLMRNKTKERNLAPTVNSVVKLTIDRRVGIMRTLLRISFVFESVFLKKTIYKNIVANNLTMYKRFYFKELKTKMQSKIFSVTCKY